MTTQNCRKLDDAAEITKMNCICGLMLAIGAAVHIILIILWLTGAKPPSTDDQSIYYWTVPAVCGIFALMCLIPLALTPRITKWQIDDIKRKKAAARYRAAAEGGL